LAIFSFFHFVAVWRLALGFDSEFGDLTACCLGNLFSFPFQEQNVPVFFFRVTTTYSTFYASETNCCGVVEVQLVSTKSKVAKLA
jgi:hypothetical protein